MDNERREKYKSVLLSMKERITKGIENLEKESIQTTQRDSSGDLSGYALHMADVGTDTFDREFALDLVEMKMESLPHRADLKTKHYFLTGNGKKLAQPLAKVFEQYKKMK